MIDVESWVDAQQKKYQINIQIEQPGNQFQHKTWHLRDPNERGLAFQITCNSEGQASLLAPDELFEAQRLNIAEGYEPETLLRFAEEFLDGSFSIVRSSLLKVPALCFKDFQSNKLVTFGTMKPYEYLKNKQRIESRIGQAILGYSSQ